MKRKLVFTIMLMLFLISVFIATFDIPLKSASVNITKISNGNMAMQAIDENHDEHRLFSLNQYEKSWDFGRVREWRNFAKVGDNSVEIVVGVNHAKSNSYDRLRKIITENNGNLVSTVSMSGKIIAIVADVPIAKTFAFSEEVRTAGFSRYIEPNLMFQASFVPNDSYWSQQWGPVKIEADWAWNTTMGDASVVVAVIDTGIDWNHPDLTANYDASGYDWVNMDDDPMDDNGHGTHCAGIIAAVINNSIGIAGLAQVRIIAEKGLDNLGRGYADDLANAIIHATDKSTDIISMSWGGPYHSELIYEAVKYAYESGVLLVAAAGNKATCVKHYPAAYKEVIAVSATDQDDNTASFTNYGDWIEVSAPGVYIYSTILSNSYDTKSGTSMSAAHVSGTSALLFSRFPNASRDQIRAKLRYTADDLGVIGFDLYHGYGRINARRAVEQDLPDHDLLVFDLETSQFIQLNDTATIKAEVLNFGTVNESNITTQLYINSSLLNSTDISFMESGALAALSFFWTPTTEGIYNVTFCVNPVQDETIIKNNALSKYIVVRTLRVPERYPTIQEAINAAFAGEPIYVSSGLYVENLVVNKTVSIIGEDKSNTTIDGNGTGVVVKIFADGATINGFTIQNGDFAGIEIRSGGNNIFDNTVRANRVNGIFLSSDIRINNVANNTITNNTNGILVESTWDGSYICWNVVMNNTNGIMLRESMFLVLKGNKLSNNSYNLLVDPAWLIPPADLYEYFHDIDDSNTVDGRPVYYWINEHDKQIPASAGYVALINCSHITVENLNLTQNSQGVLLASTTDSTVRNVNASDNRLFGIALEFSSERNLVENNIIERTNRSGILLAWYSGYNKIVNNTIFHGGFGMEIGAYNNEIIGNAILSNEYGIQILGNGNILRFNNMTNNTYNFGLENFIQDIDISNTVNGKPIYYWTNEHEKQVPSDAGYVAIINSTGITIKNLNLTNNFEGVLVAYSNNTLIDCVNISTVDYGIRIYSSHHNNVSFSTILNSGKGISLEFSNNNAITYSSILNSAFGVFLEESNSNFAIGNTIIASYSNIYIASSHGNQICQNKVSNSHYAISIGGSSHNNLVETNLITNNYIGISIYDSYENTVTSNTVELSSYYGIYFCRSTSNKIYHNNFINNINQVFDREGNIFDDGYPSGGNYWSDYTGVDEKSGPNQDQPRSDGIGDTPYPLFPYGEDRYPLMNPWIMIHDISILNLTFSTENPKTNETLYIYVTLQNKGNFTETLDVSVNYTRIWDPLIGTQTITLEPGATITINFTWTPTTSGRYEIKAYTSTIPYDTNPSDNTKITYLYII